MGLRKNARLPPEASLVDLAAGGAPEPRVSRPAMTLSPPELVDLLPLLPFHHGDEQENGCQLSFSSTSEGSVTSNSFRYRFSRHRESFNICLVHKLAPRQRVASTNSSKGRFCRTKAAFGSNFRVGSAKQKSNSALTRSADLGPLEALGKDRRTLFL